jgi:hypothetical protein
VTDGVRARLAGLLERCLGSGSIEPKPGRARRQIIRQQGRHFHLGAIFDRINGDYFAGEVTAAITWGRRSGRKRLRSIRLGSYRSEQNLIRINPALDAVFVPPYVIEALVHHEMLHAVIPVRKGESGRRVVHGQDFRAREREFHSFRQARRWTRENLGLLLHNSGAVRGAQYSTIER